MTTIKLNVGGTHFETTIETADKSSRLRTIIEGTLVGEVPFIDRSAVLFEHVLCLLRDPNYPFPWEFTSELDYYEIEYDRKQMSTKHREMKELLSKVEICYNYICEIKKQSLF